MARVVVALAALLPFVFVNTIESPVPLPDRTVAAVLWCLCLLPAWLLVLAKPESRPPLPLLPAIGVIYGWYYALPITYGAFDQHYSISVDPVVDYAAPLRLALIGWAMLLLGYRLSGARWLVGAKREQAKVDVESRNFSTTVGPVLVVGGLLLSRLPQLIAIDTSLNGLVQFGDVVFSFGISLLIARHVTRTLTFGEALVLWPSLGLAVVLALASSFISALVLIWVTVLFTIWAVRQSLGAKWTLVVVSVVLGAVLFKGVIDDFRRMQRYTGTASIPVRIAQLGSLLGDKIRREGVAGALTQGQRTTAARSATLEIFADVIRRTPSDVPYWNGATYLSLVGAAVPRVLWPDKPSKELGQEFGHRYEYLSPEDFNTSFNFPFLVEFYANFGIVGVWIGMFVVGIVYRRIEFFVNRPGQRIMTSCLGVVLCLPLMILEVDFSLMFGGLLLNGAALWLIMRTIEVTAARAPVTTGLMGPVVISAHTPHPLRKHS